MRYLILVEYRIQRRLTIHAANGKQAAAKAVNIVSTWRDAQDPQVLKITEPKGESDAR